MTESESRLLAREIAKELDARRTVDEKTHAEHHNWIYYRIEQDRKYSEMISEVKKGVLIWISIGLLLGILSLATYWFQNYPRPSLKAETVSPHD